MELPGRYVFTSYESTLHSKLKQLVNGVDGGLSQEGLRDGGEKQEEKEEQEIFRV